MIRPPLLLLIGLLPLGIWGYEAIHLKSQTSPDVQAAAVKGMLKRIVGDRSKEFVVAVDPSIGPKDRDTFKLETSGNLTSVTGSSGVAAASGVHYFLKYFCGCHISWSGKQIYLPPTLPPIETPVKIVSNDKFRYYQNVCTASYSSVWWNWTRWEDEIDWMALNGINLPLAFTGQEVIWRKVFQKLNFTDHDLNEFFTGPAFLAWNRMGNVQAWAGPLSSNWHIRQTSLQHRILKRMRSFGMLPVLPAFSGHIPPSFRRIYPNASVVKLSKSWGHFDPPYGDVLFLQPTDPLFWKIGTTFLNMYITEFGTDHLYNTDLFNEMPPPSKDPTYLGECSKSVFRIMEAADSSAIWLLQGWMFVNDEETWQPPQARAFLTSVPKGRMIVLDLQSEMYPEFQRLESYYGQPFIWCMLHNYGGVLGLYGSMDAVNKGPFEGRDFTNSTMIGTGLTPEGIQTNDVMYELMNEMAWRKEPVDLDLWIFNFTSRRYGNSSVDVAKAWRLLKGSVFNASAPFRNHGKYILTTRPSLKRNAYIWYNAGDVFEAWKYFVNAADVESFSKQETFRYDLVDISRQALQLIMAGFYDHLKECYKNKDLLELKNVSSSILELYDDLDDLLASNVHFLLGPWLEAAKSFASTPQEKKEYEYNARNQITLWGPSGQILDYANKQWSGLVSGYYRKRWQLFLSTLERCIEEARSFNESEFNYQVLQSVEEPFTLSSDLHPIHPKGDSIDLSRRLLRKYENIPNSLSFVKLTGNEGFPDLFYSSK